MLTVLTVFAYSTCLHVNFETKANLDSNKLLLIPVNLRKYGPLKYCFLFPTCMKKS